MTASSSTNASWIERAEVLAGASVAGFSLPHEVDFVVERGQGSRVWDVDGREYIDFLLGSGPMILGHAHPAVAFAVAEQIGRGTTFYSLNQRAIELAELMVSAIPCAERVRYGSTGAEATAYAMRLARAYSGRDKLLKFEGGYHGSHDAALQSFAPSEPTFFPEPQQDSAGITQGVSQDILIAPYNDIEKTAEIARANKDSLAAIIVEPQQRGILPVDGFMSDLRKLADETGALLIFDEVVTGFRIAWGGAQEVYGVQPDLAAYGKIIGGGFPLSAVAGRAEVVDLSDTRRKGRPDYVHLSGTLSGNPVASVAGLATLRELEKPGTYEQLHALGSRLRAGLAQAAENVGVPTSIVGDGPIAAVHFTDRPITNYADVLSGDRALLTKVNTGLVRRGIFAQLSTKFYISLAHTDEDIDKAIGAFEESLRESRA